MSKNNELLVTVDYNDDVIKCDSVAFTTPSEPVGGRGLSLGYDNSKKLVLLRLTRNINDKFVDDIIAFSLEQFIEFLGKGIDAFIPPS